MRAVAHLPKPILRNLQNLPLGADDSEKFLGIESPAAFDLGHRVIYQLIRVGAKRPAEQ